jgi:glycerophosphoryl diester phosphodiesterase
MHDKTLDRTTNGTGDVEQHTFDQIRALDAGVKFSQDFAGAKVPTLDEAFDLAHGKINVYVDTKEADPQQLVDTIVRHDMQDHVVVYGNPFFLYDVHRIRPSLRIMPEAFSADVCKLLVHVMQLQVIAFDASDFKDPVIDCAKTASAKIYVDRLGDADNADTWQKAIDLGAAGIQTNRPAELADYLRAHGQATH